MRDTEMHNTNWTSHLRILVHVWEASVYKAVRIGKFWGLRFPSFGGIQKFRETSGGKVVGESKWKKKTSEGKGFRNACNNSEKKLAS